MKNSLQKLITMTIPEFYMLSAFFGVNKLYGYECDVCNYSKKEMTYLLHDMVTKNIFEINNDVFKCCKEYEQIGSYIKNSDLILKIKKNSSKGPMCIGYINEQIMITQIVSTNITRINIEWKDKKDIVSYVRSQGCFKAIWDTFIQSDSNNYNDKVLFEAQIIDVHNEQILRILKVLYINQKYRVVYKQQDEYEEIYEGIDNIENMLEKLISE